VGREEEDNRLLLTGTLRIRCLDNVLSRGMQWVFQVLLMVQCADEKAYVLMMVIPRLGSPSESEGEREEILWCMHRAFVQESFLREQVK